VILYRQLSSNLAIKDIVREDIQVALPDFFLHSLWLAVKLFQNVMERKMMSLNVAV
jgi:hypothetical protein